MSKLTPTVGMTVYAVKSRDDGTDATDHRFGYNSSMDSFATGQVKGTIERIDDDGAIIVRISKCNSAFYDAKELRATPRRPVVSKAALRTKKVLAKAPKKVYAVVKGGSVYPVASREQARDLKSMLGGKAEGAIIVRYDITAEIR